MLFAASESAVTKNPRLRLTMRRSSSVRPAGSFHRPMSRLMLISCGIQWLAQAARYFSQAHLYLKGTSWLTSAFELMTFLSSAVTRRKAFPAGAGSSSFTAVAGTNAAVGWIARPGIAVNLLSSSKLSMGLSSCCCCGQGQQLFVGRRALRLTGVVHLAGGDVQVPFRAGERQPVPVLGVLPDERRRRQVLAMAEVQRVEHEEPPAGHHDGVPPGGFRRRPPRGDERTGELAGPQGHPRQ